jgi:hypothetical protein
METRTYKAWLSGSGYWHLLVLGLCVYPSLAFILHLCVSALLSRRDESILIGLLAGNDDAMYCNITGMKLFLKTSCR